MPGRMVKGTLLPTRSEEAGSSYQCEKSLRGCEFVKGERKIRDCCQTGKICVFEPSVLALISALESLIHSLIHSMICLF